MTRPDLIEEVSRALGTSRKDSDIIVVTILNGIVRSLRSGERVEIRGFGSFGTESWWQLELFRFLKGRSRAASLHDYRAEKDFVDQVPHRILISPSTEEERRSAKEPPKDLRRSRRPKGCPF